MVFFIEGDIDTPIADLNGTGSQTPGDWITGTPYPIFNPVNPQCAQFLSDYKIQGYPSFFLICPDKKIYTLRWPTESDILSNIRDSCVRATLDASTIAMQTSIMCTNTFSPIVSLNNGGTTSLTTCKLTYKIDNGSPLTFNWTGNLASKNTINVTLPGITTTPGDHTLTVVTSIPNGGQDQFQHNDSKTYPLHVFSTTGSALPYSEGFEGTFPVTGLYINNPQEDITWKKTSTVGGFGASNSCIYYDAYNNSDSEFDEFILAPVNLSGVTSPILEFNLAYAQLDEYTTEILEVLISTDCAQTWSNIYTKSAANLATAGFTEDLFIPAANEWRKEIIDLSTFNTNSSVHIKFKISNYHGNALYIDDINVNHSIGIKEDLIDYSLSVFPSPACEFINVAFLNNSTEQVMINLYNGLGELVKNSAHTVSKGQQNIKLSVQGLPKGFYTLELRSGNGSVSRKISVQ